MLSDNHPLLPCILSTPLAAAASTPIPILLVDPLVVMLYRPHSFRISFLVLGLFAFRRE